MEMLDEIVSTKIEDGKVMVKSEILSPAPEDVKHAVADFVQSYRQFTKTNSRPDAATDANLSMAWWKRLENLALADSRLKDIFCGRDRSPRSIAQYNKFRLKMIAGRRYRTDA